MVKRTLGSDQKLELAQALHIAVLDALMASRRWEPGELVFQGGTSLHLAHSSPRFSEDLDFLVSSSLDLQSVGGAVQSRLQDLSWLPAGAELVVSKAKEEGNPHKFIVSIRGDEIIGSVKVKVELWKTAPEAMADLQVVVAPVQASRGLVAGMQTFVPTADLDEIYADKVFAVVARKALKPRDVFDLHWLKQHGELGKFTREHMEVRLATYPNMKPDDWLSKAAERRVLLAQSSEMISSDLKNWLPTSWPMTAKVAESMAKAAIEAIDEGVDVMRSILDVGCEHGGNEL